MKLPMTQKKIIGALDDTGLETVKNLSSEVKKSLVKELGKESLDTMWAQILGSQEKSKAKSHGGDMQEGQEIDLKNAHQETQRHIEAAYDYREEILQGETKIVTENNQEIQVRIQEIMIELKKVIDSSKELQIQFKQISVEQPSAKPGKYHLNFVEWLLQNVRDIRMQIEDSGAWLAAFKSKKDKKGYWNMFKKHGTSFGLSNERSVATNVG